jgi:hypothetical protein
MNAVSRAFSEVPARRGLVIGIVPSAAEGTAAEPRQGYPNPWVEITVFTHLPMSGRSGTDPMSRNHINVLSSNVLVALPGGSGTASEVSLAIRYGRPVSRCGAGRGRPGEDQGVRAREDRVGKGRRGATTPHLSNNPAGPSSNLAERAAVV